MEVVVEIQFYSGDVFTFTYDDEDVASEQQFELELEKVFTSLEDIKTVLIRMDGVEILDDEEDCARKVAAIRERMKDGGQRS